MSAPTTNADSPAVEELIAQQAKAFARELLRIADDAPDGQVLRLAELFVLERGRELLRSSLEMALRSQAEAVEKKGRPRGGAPAATAATTKGPPSSGV